jgi:putative FmdB family regulatory protein
VLIYLISKIIWLNSALLLTRKIFCVNIDILYRLGGTLMPVFEYECKECGKKFAVLVRNESEKPDKCPDEKCGSSEITKLISSFSTSRSGSGVDMTDVVLPVLQKVVQHLESMD